MLEVKIQNNASCVQNARPTIRTTLQFVTPSQAAEWLSKNNAGNRGIRRGLVDDLRQIILDGKWETTHQGIAFYEDGSLADGQHRLSAIVAADVGVWVSVTTGLQRIANHAIDRGIARTQLDSVNFLGMKSDRRRVAICQCMIYQYETELSGCASWRIERIRSERFASFYERFQDAIEFAIGFGGKYPAPVPAAAATAWFTEDISRLSEFLLILESGETFGDGDRAALRMRDHLKDRKYGFGQSARNDLFLRCCSALRYFLERRSLSKLYATPENAFKFADVVGEVR